MKRREFITLLGGAAAMWPLVASAQQGRRFAALWPFTEGDVEGQALFAVFRQGLRELGWANVQIDSRWGGGNIERTGAYAAELVRLSPDVIFAYFNAQLAPVSRETRTIPIVFVGASDPVGAGYVASLARPGGNVTGFTLYEQTLAGKWLGFLKEVTPGIARVVSSDQSGHRDPSRNILLASARSRRSFSKHRAHNSEVYTPADIEAAIGSLGKQPGSGLIVAPDTFSEINGDLIVSLAAQHRVPPSMQSAVLR